MSETTERLKKDIEENKEELLNPQTINKKKSEDIKKVWKELGEKFKECNVKMGLNLTEEELSILVWKHLKNLNELKKN